MSIEIQSPVSGLASIPVEIGTGISSAQFSPSLDLTSGLSGGYANSYLENLNPYPNFGESSIEVISNPFIEPAIPEPIVPTPSFRETLDLSLPQPRGLAGIDLSFGNFVPKIEIPTVQPETQTVDLIGSVLNLESPEPGLIIGTKNVVKPGELTIPTLVEQQITADRVQLKKVEAALQAAQFDSATVNTIITNTAQEMEISLVEEEVTEQKKSQQLSQEKVLTTVILIAQVDTTALKAREYAVKEAFDIVFERDEHVKGEDILKALPVSIKQISELVKSTDQMVDSNLPYDGSLMAVREQIGRLGEINSKSEGLKLVGELVNEYMPVRVSEYLNSKTVTEGEIHQVLYGQTYIPETAPLEAELSYLVNREPVDLSRKPELIKSQLDQDVIDTKNLKQLQTVRKMLLIRIQEAEVRLDTQSQQLVIAA